MGTNDIMRLLSTDDRGIAEEIKDLLEESEIYTMLVTDNPASSFLNTYFGLNPIENVELQINKSDYHRAIEILNESPYKDLVSNE